MWQEVLGDAKVSLGLCPIRIAHKSIGIELSEQGRYTDVSKKINGRWVYIVDHPSGYLLQAQPDSA